MILYLLEMRIIIFTQEMLVTGTGFKIMWMGGGYKWNNELIIDEAR